jgi:hypothetical protein
MRIGIVGSRGFKDYKLLKDTLDNFKSITAIISGGAKGADSLGTKYADNNGIEKIIHYPDWDEHGKSAGFVRNSDIVRDSDLVISFWDGKSKGTRDSIAKAYKTRTPIMVIHYRGE